MNSYLGQKNPYKVIISRYVTEKSMLLQELHRSESNVCSKRCQTPKYVFLVDKRATKTQIATAIEQIYANKKIKVVGVNTINTKPKAKRVRGKSTYGKTASFKKAIVSLAVGDLIES